MNKEPAKRKSKLVDILVVIALSILGVLILFKDDTNINNVSYQSKKPKEKEEKYIPAQLKWFDNFKGIDNMNRSSQEKAGNFISYERQKNR
jgi:hypothetical protein